MDTTLLLTILNSMVVWQSFVIVLLEYLNLPWISSRDYHAAGWCLCRKGGLSLLSVLLFLLPPENLEAGYYIFLGAYGGNAFLKGI